MSERRSKRTRKSPSTTSDTAELPNSVDASGDGTRDILTTPVKTSGTRFDLDTSQIPVEDLDQDFADDLSIHPDLSPKVTFTSPSFQGGYDALKSFNGQVYKGMAIGGSHTWNYDPGIWKETKVEPDLWKIDFDTKKRRAKNAPKGSGAPVGTEYHWIIVAHQHVKKIDANTYETRLVGSKYKLAHKNASSNSWSVNTVKAQREREVELLEDAKRRIQGLPPVLAVEKVRIDKRE